MYCYHCGKKINESKIEAKQSSFACVSADIEIDSTTEVCYVCPRCGHLISKSKTTEDEKSLSRASHAQLQRARNEVAKGMGSLSLCGIAMIISWLFFFLACKPSNQFQLVVTCAEFYVFLVLLIVALTLLGYGGVMLIKGLRRKHESEVVLRDLQNKTFVQ